MGRESLLKRWTILHPTSYHRELCLHIHIHLIRRPVLRTDSIKKTSTGTLWAQQSNRAGKVNADFIMELLEFYSTPLRRIGMGINGAH